MSAPVLPGDNADLFPDDLPPAGTAFDESPAAFAQRARLLEALRLGPVSTFKARDALGILMPAARVFELKVLGYGVRTDRIGARDSAGVWHTGIASYVLVSEPQPAGVAA